MSFAITYLTKDTALQTQVNRFTDLWNEGAETFTVETSGSTGPPKKIVLSRNQLIASAKRTLNYFGLKPGDSALLAISPATIGGKMMIVRAMIGGLYLFISAPKANPLADLPSGTKLDFAPLVPLQIRAIERKSPELLTTVRTILLGGSPVSPELEQRLAELHDRMFIGFGMTETVSHVAVRKAGNPVYTALEGVTFSENEGALTLSDRLLNIENLQTNDSVHLKDVTHFEWLGRTDFVINSGGIKIHPEQLERLLSAYIDAPFFVAGKPDAAFGEICMLVVDPQHGSPDLAKLQQVCRENIGKYAVPKTIVYVPMVYGNGNKINRKATLQQMQNPA